MGLKVSCGEVGEGEGELPPHVALQIWAPTYAMPTSPLGAEGTGDEAPICSPSQVAPGPGR